MLDWKVLRYDFNNHKINNYNIFGTSDSYEKQLKKARRKKEFTNYEELKEYLRKDFLYHFWSKSECEILVGSLSSNLNELEKIDIYRQLEMNLDRITEYIIKELKFRF